MPSITAAKRTKLFLALAAFLGLILLFVILATSLPEWSKSGNTVTGLWESCVDPPDNGWTGRVCTEIKKVPVCDGWYQAARTFSLFCIGLLTAAFFLALVNAAFADRMGKALPAALACIIFAAWFCVLFVWMTWIILRAQSCLNQDGQKLGASWFLQLFAWLFLFAALGLAAYLLVARVSDGYYVDDNGFVNKTIVQSGAGDRPRYRSAYTPPPISLRPTYVPGPYEAYPTGIPSPYPVVYAM